MRYSPPGTRRLSRPALRLLIAGGVALFLTVVAPLARADFQANFTGANPALTLSLHYDNGGVSPVFNGNVSTGRYNWRSNDPNRPGWLSQSFWTFCIELTDTFSSPVTFRPDLLENAPQEGLGAGTGPGNPNGAMGAAKADKLREFWAENVSPTFTNLGAAAFQLGIWEILFDNGLAPSTSSGGYLDYLGTGQLKLNQLTNANPNENEDLARLEANRMLSTLDGSGPREHRLVALVSNGGGPNSEQDQLTVRSMPVPPSLFLAGIGVLSLFGMHWRRRAAR